MSTRSKNDGQQYARNRSTCDQCKHLKKKCDRQRPRCGLCLERGRNCSFMKSNNLPDFSGSPSSNDSYALSAEDFKSRITAIYYLDSVLVNRSINQLPETSFSPNSAVLDYLGDFRNDQAFITQYFVGLHPWMPFLSKRTFMERILNPLGFAWPWNLLLMAAMKLLTTTPPDPNPKSSHYLSVRADVFSAIDSGLLELRIFQSMLLIAGYELGHAIYPAAYLTIGMCIHYGKALRLDQSIENNTDRSEVNVQAEEQRRSWWTLLLLDKYLSLGAVDRRSTMTCPGRDVILPADDGLWEKGDHTKLKPHRLSEPLSAEMGRFCLTSQVVILLERIMQNISDRSSSDEFREQEAKILDDAVSALTSVAIQEARSRGFNVCSPITACYSARFLLYYPERTVGSAPAMSSDRVLRRSTVESEIAAEMLKIAEATSPSKRCGQ